MNENYRENPNFDTYHINGVTYAKEAAYLGNRTQEKIGQMNPGQKVDFIDVMQSKFKEALKSKVDLNK